MPEAFTDKFAAAPQTADALSPSGGAGPLRPSAVPPPGGPSTAAVAPRVAADGGGHRIVSSAQLKVTLALFVTALLVVLSLLIFLLVTRIFGELTPSMRAELEWKVRRGAVELAETAD